MNKNQKLPLSWFLVIPFVVQIFTAVGLTGYLSIRNGNKIINKLANQIKTEVSERVSAHLDAYLSVPQQINQINLAAMKLNLLDLENFESTGQYFWQQMQVFNVGYINYANQTGEFIGVERQVSGYPLINQVQQSKGLGELYIYETDEQGNKGELIEIKSGYDPRIEAWYADAIVAGHPVWSEIYQWEDQPEVLSISSSYPVYDDTETIIGVIGVDHILSQINDFLATLKVSQSGVIFILEPNGFLVASSTDEKPFTIKNNQAKRLPAINSQHPQIQAATHYLKQQFTDLDKIESSQSLEFTIDGETQFLRVTPWQDELGLNWLIITNIPKSDFTQEIEANTRITILLCLLALCVSILTGIITARRIAQPISQLSQATQDLAIAARNRFGQHNKILAIEGQQNIAELEVLATSFNQMLEQLLDSFKNIDQLNIELENRVKQRTEALANALQELKATQSQLIQTEKMSSLGQMVAGIAHEINNPVSFIHGNLTHAHEYVDNLLNLINSYQESYPNPPENIKSEIEAIDLDFIKEDLIKLLNSMEVGTLRIREIVQSLRTFSRLDEAEFKWVDLHEGLESTLMILNNRLTAKPGFSGIEIVRDYSKLPQVECYAGQINQVFMNLLNNAIDAIEEAHNNPSNQPGKITIQTALIQDHWVRIVITDNGIGISEDIQSRLFDPFFTTKTVGKGTGLGLSMSYQIIVNKHHGQIECESIVGTGTSFIIKIPTCQSKAG